MKFTFADVLSAEEIVQKRRKSNMDNDRIIQVIPCTKPMIAIYEPEGSCEDYWFSWIYHIGLKEDGSIVPLDVFDGYLISADEMSNFVGAWYGTEYLEEEKFYEKMKEWKENQSER